MSQCLPCMHWDLSLIPRTYGNKPGVVVHACNPSAENWRQAALWDVACRIGGLPSLFGEQQKTLVSKNKVAGVFATTYSPTRTLRHLHTCNAHLRREHQRGISMFLFAPHTSAVSSALYLCHCLSAWVGTESMSCVN